jgi:hypothetical protein
MLIPTGIVAAIFAAYANRWPDWISLPAIGLLFAVPVAAGLVLRKRPRWHGFAIGLLVGTGIAALLEGICFMANIR